MLFDYSLSNHQTKQLISDGTVTVFLKSKYQQLVTRAVDEPKTKDTVAVVR
jgi:hypothetical protein